jgi:putative SOS response-associated peptidase YedK
LRARQEEVAEHFEIDAMPELVSRYNIAPGQSIATVRATESGERLCEFRSWGLVPRWAKTPSIGNRMVNARAETVAEKPAFRAAFSRQRCLIPADGFYEWAGRSTPKQPYLITRVDDGLFAFAGLWEEWVGEEGRAIHSCSIVTTSANRTLEPIHPRMPVILAPADYPAWLDSCARDTAHRNELMAPCPESWLRLQPVGLRVNDTSHDDPECSAPAPAQAIQESFL